MTKKHYYKNYFDWQISCGEFGGWADRNKFIGLYIRFRHCFGLWLWWRIYT